MTAKEWMNTEMQEESRPSFRRPLSRTQVARSNLIGHMALLPGVVEPAELPAFVAWIKATWPEQFVEKKPVKKTVTKYKPVWSYRSPGGGIGTSWEMVHPLFDSVSACCRYMNEHEWAARGDYLEYRQWCEPVEVEAEVDE